MNLDRRDFLTAGALGLAGAAALGAAPIFAQQATATAAEKKKLAALFPGSVDENGKYVLPKLKYAYDAVSEVIDPQTMELHHTRHHQAYVNGLIAAEEKLAAVAAGDEAAAALVTHYAREASFHGGGHYLHSVFWDCIGPDGMGEPPTGALAAAITRDFGGYDQMMRLFSAACKRVEGSGWGILGYSIAADKLVIIQAQNQQLLSPWAVIPLMANDVWEHAYYLKYQNNRAAYVDAFPKIINWHRVAERYALLAG